ncbi:MAG TPA: hypothetical protein DDZ90_13075 [Planctomycetaceae bacterium]|nr:hypothetical protein [Gimesia sp.]HBL44316.1 hypothetical protein [Planctomycetaceae bacterium]
MNKVLMALTGGRFKRPHLTHESFLMSVNQRMGKGNKSSQFRESSDFEVSLKPEKAAGKKAHSHHLY